MRNILIAGGLAALAAVGAVAANDESSVVVPEMTDFTSIAVRSAGEGVPVMMYFSARSCDYCERLEDNILKPMIMSGEDHGRVIINKVMLDGDTEVRDFQGAKISTSDLASHYGVKVTPTLVFTDKKGHPLTRNLVGYNGSEFFAAYMDEAIDAAKKQIPSL